MRPKTKTWIGLGIVLAVVATLVWQFAGPRRGKPATQDNAAAPGAFSLRLTNAMAAARATPAPMSPAGPVPGTPYTVIATNIPNAPFTNQFAYRLTNTVE